MQSLHAGALVLVAATMLLPLGTGGLWPQPADGTSSRVETEDLSDPLLQSDHATKVSLDQTPEWRHAQQQIFSKEANAKMSK